MKHRFLEMGIARYRDELEPTPRERRGFAGAARWVARAMGATIDDRAARRAARLLRYKYLASLITAIAAGSLACRAHFVLGIVAFVLAFYAVEVQGVFMVPLVVRGALRPVERSRSLVVAAGGTVSCVVRVLPIAAWMLFAGFGRGFVRAWCEGCLAVIAWFEEIESNRA